ncbi:MAG: hypothetical protein U0R44_02595 [Candidatus Micrarchaeia archaeon]
MKRALLIALAVLLVFGCAGARTKVQPAGGVGDSDIAPQPEPREPALSTEEVIPPADDGVVPAGQLPSDQDLGLGSDSEPDLISNESVIEPA